MGGHGFDEDNRLTFLCFVECVLKLENSRVSGFRVSSGLQK